jgi:dienelactone hydrolase
MITLALLLTLCPVLAADGEQDNRPDNVRPIPPPGVAVPEPDRSELAAGLAELGKEIETLRGELKGKTALLPDVQIYHKAVRYALEGNEFFNVKEIPVAKAHLKSGLDRAKALREGKPAWIASSGLLALGYVSRIDGSVQPYGLVIPPSWQPGSSVRHRLDTWFHGRGETLSELAFIDQRQKSPGEFAPRDAFVLHLYGRYCNANKFAGEIDLLEALEDVKRRYPIDEDRIVVRGFSMGGAACWQFAVHYADRWCAAAPGAGFSETPDFLKVFQNEKVAPTPWEQTLWHWYDCTDWAVNLRQLPTVAYSGEDDKQKQAADIMGKALAAEGIELTHILGPKTGHKYHPEAKAEINRRIDAIAARGRDRSPPSIRFTTWTLRYNRMHWITVDRLEKHWIRARVDADVDAARGLTATTRNVLELTFEFPSGTSPFPTGRGPAVLIDGQALPAPVVPSDRSWKASYRKAGGTWGPAGPAPAGLVKRHGLQGPIDDAFMDSFVFVKPGGKPLHEATGAWAAKELDHAIREWRRQFRGDARVVDDDKIGDAEIGSSNLVLWGDVQSNRLLARIASNLPVRMNAAEIAVGDQRFPAATHVPLLIHPNPLNPDRYVVLNSGFTFREYDYLNNARQVAKLPDWAVVDVTTPPNSRYPGKIVAAGFFNEAWEVGR